MPDASGDADARMPRIDHGQPDGKADAAGGFQTTHWSLVLRAGNRADREAEDALAALCGRYWYPLYAYVRRRTADQHEAQDLTQEFFARLLEKNTLAAASPERGRFRSFLLTAVKNFIANQHDWDHAAKRGGRGRTLSLDWDSGESRIKMEPAHDLTPERLFESQWVLTLLELVMRRLQQECEAAGKAGQFERLKEVLTGGRSGCHMPKCRRIGHFGRGREAGRQPPAEAISRVAPKRSVANCGGAARHRR